MIRVKIDLIISGDHRLRAEQRGGGGDGEVRADQQVRARHLRARGRVQTRGPGAARVLRLRQHGRLLRGHVQDLQHVAIMRTVSGVHG